MNLLACAPSTLGRRNASTTLKSIASYQQRCTIRPPWKVSPLPATQTTPPKGAAIHTRMMAGSELCINVNKRPGNNLSNELNDECKLEIPATRSSTACMARVLAVTRSTMAIECLDFLLLDDVDVDVDTLLPNASASTVVLASLETLSTSSILSLKDDELIDVSVDRTS
jgi:hypothetical protein